MKVIVTGSRGWTDRKAIEDRLRRLPPDATIVHGKASKGADRIAGEIAHAIGFAVIECPADWRVGPDTPPGAIKRRPNGAPYDVRAGLLRNVRMFVEHGPIDLVLAFRIGNSNGTTHCMQEGLARGVPVEVDDR